MLSRPFGLLAGVTPIIDRYRIVTSALGERFLKVRMGTDASEAVPRAVAHSGTEEVMRKNISEAVFGALDYYGPRVEKAQEPDNAITGKIIALARIGAMLRSEVRRDRRGNLDYLPSPEIGTRLGKQLMRLGQTLATFHEVDRPGYAEYQLLARVMTDSIPKQREKILKALREGRLSTGEVIDRSQLPDSTVRQALEDLWVLGVVNRHQSSLSNHWSLTGDTTDLLTSSGLFQHADQGV